MDMKEKYDTLLIQLVSMFHFAALQQMGKVKNPVTEAIERDLHQAQVSIDMIDMLHEKMKGNLSKEEERLFTNALQELKLNYVDEVAKDKAAGTTAGSAPNPDGAART